MTRGSPADAGSADDRQEHLDRTAGCALELHGLIAALPPPDRDALRIPLDLVLAEIGRCIARRMGPSDAPGSDEGLPHRTRRMSA